MEQKGTLLICDRCDKKEFLKDDHTLMPHFKTVPLKTKYEGNALLCEDCYKKYSKMIDDFWKVIKTDEVTK